MNWYCKKCNHKLTVMDLQQASSARANMKDEAVLIGPGLYINASELNIPFEIPIAFLVNKESVNLFNHKDTSRLAGCCGPGNLHVFNQVCPNCSAEIGVIMEDCLFPHFVGISGNAVSKEPLW